MSVIGTLKNLNKINGIEDTEREKNNEILDYHFKAYLVTAQGLKAWKDSFARKYGRCK